MKLTGKQEAQLRFVTTPEGVKIKPFSFIKRALEHQLPTIHLHRFPHHETSRIGSQKRNHRRNAPSPFQVVPTGW